MTEKKEHLINEHTTHSRSHKNMREEKVEFNSINVENRTIECIYATERPYRKFFEELGDTYEEILVNRSNNDVDITRLNESAPLLYNHTPELQIGKVERAWVSDDVCCAVVRFADYSHIPFEERTDLMKKTEEIWEQVKQGIRNNISFGYEYALGDPLNTKIDDFHKKIYVKNRKDIEISIVDIPADSAAQFRAKTETNLNIKAKMTDQNSNDNDDFIKMLPELIGMEESEVEEKLRELGKSDEETEKNMKSYRDFTEEMEDIRSYMKSDMEDEHVKNHLIKMGKSDEYAESYLKYKAMKGDTAQFSADQHKDKQEQDGSIPAVQDAEKSLSTRSKTATKDETSEILKYSHQKGIEDSVATSFVRSKQNPTLAQYKEHLLESQYKNTSKYTVDNTKVTRQLDKKAVVKRALSIAAGSSAKLNDSHAEGAAQQIARGNKFSSALDFMEVDGGMKRGESGDQYLHRVYTKALNGGNSECTNALLDIINAATSNVNQVAKLASKSFTKQIMSDSVENAKREYKGGLSNSYIYNLRNLTSSDLGISTASVNQADVPFIAPNWPDMMEMFNARPFISKEPQYDRPSYINIKYNGALFSETPELSRGKQMQQLNYSTIGTMKRYSLSIDHSWEAMLADVMDIIPHMQAQFSNGYELRRNAIIGSILFGVNPDTGATFVPTYQKLSKLTQYGLPDFSSATTSNFWTALPGNNISDPASNKSNWLSGCDLNTTNYNIAVMLIRKQAFTLNQGDRIIPYKFEPQYLIVHQDDYEKALNIFKEIYPIMANVDSKVFNPAAPSTALGLAQGLAQPLTKIPILTYREGDFNIEEGTGDHSWFVTSVPTQTSAFYDMRWAMEEGIVVQNRFINEELRFATSAYAYSGIGFGIPQAIIRATPTNISPFRSGNERGEESAALYNESKRGRKPNIQE